MENHALGAYRGEKGMVLQLVSSERRLKASGLSVRNPLTWTR